MKMNDKSQNQQQNDKNNASFKINDVANIIKSAVANKKDNLDSLKTSIIAIDNFVSVIINSQIGQPETLKALDNATNNIKKVIGSLTTSISDIVMSLAKLEAENSFAIFNAGTISLFSSIKMIKNAINNGDQFSGPAAIIASYVNLISLIAELSEYSQSIDTRAIRKASRATSLVFKYLYKTQRNIAIKAKLLERIKLSDAIDIFFEQTNHMMSMLIRAFQSVVQFISIYEEAGGKSVRKSMRRAIRTVFGAYADIVIGSIQLGELLFTGDLSPSWIIPIKYKPKTHFGVGGIVKGLTALMLLTGYYNQLFKLFPPIMEQLNFIGSNRRNIIRGLRGLKIVLFGYGGKKGESKSITGLLTIFDNRRFTSRKLISTIKKMVKTTALLGSYAIFFKLLDSVIDTIVKLGSETINTIKGLKLLEIMLINNGRKDKIKSLPYIFNELGKSKNKQRLSNALLVMISLTFMMSTMFIIYNSLKFAGENYRYIKRGVRATELILLGSSGVLGIGKQKSLIQIIGTLKKKDFNTLVKAIPAVAMLTAMSILLVILAFNLTTIGRNRRYIKRGVKAVGYMVNLLDYFADLNNIIKKRKITPEKIKGVAKILLLVTGTLTIVALAASVIGMSLIGILLAIPALVALKLVIVEIVWIAKYIKDNENEISQSAKSFRRVGGLLFILAKIFIIFAGAALTWTIIWMASVSMLAVVAGMAAVILALILIAKLPLNQTAISMITMLAIAASVYLMAKAFVSISNYASSINFKVLLLFAGMLVVFAGVFSLIGLMTPLLVLAVAGAAAMTLIGMAIILMIIPLIILSKVDVSTLDLAKSNAIAIINTSLDIIKSLISASLGLSGIETGESDGWVKQSIISIFGTAAGVIESVLAFGIIAFTFLSVTMILLTAVVISGLSRINMGDIEHAKENARNVIAIGMDIIKSICRNPDEGVDTASSQQKTSFGSFLKRIFTGTAHGIMNVIDSILSFGFIAFIMVTIGMITLLAKNLQYLAGLKLDNEKITTNVDNVISTSQMIITKLKSSKIKDIKGNLDPMTRLTIVISEMKKNVKNLNELSEFNIEGVDQIVNTIISIAENLSYREFKIDLKGFTKMSTSLAGFVTAINIDVKATPQGIETIAYAIDSLVPAMNKVKIDFKLSSLTNLAMGVSAFVNMFSKSMNITYNDVDVITYTIMTISKCISKIKLDFNNKQRKNLASYFEILRKFIITLSVIKDYNLSKETVDTIIYAINNISNSLNGLKIDFDIKSFERMSDGLHTFLKSLKINVTQTIESIDIITYAIGAIPAVFEDFDVDINFKNFEKMSNGLATFVNALSIDKIQVKEGIDNIAYAIDTIPKVFAQFDVDVNFNNFKKMSDGLVIFTDAISREISIDKVNFIINALERIPIVFNNVDIDGSKIKIFKKLSDGIKLFVESISIVDGVELSISHVDAIIHAANDIPNVINGVTIDQAKIDLLGKLSKSLDKFVKSVNTTGNVETNTSSIDKIINIIEHINIDDNKIRIINSLSDSTGKFLKVLDIKSEKITKNVDKLINFVDKVNTIKLENLKTATNMFQQMSEFSKSISGNFEGLANALNEKIMPLLEELKGLLEGTSQAANGIQANISTGVGSNNVPERASINPTTPAPVAQSQTTAKAKDYTSVLEALKNEISNIEKIMTNGTMISKVNSY